MPVYDDQKPTHDSHDYPLVGGDDRFDDKKKKILDEDDLKNAESAGSDGSGGSIDEKEQSMFGNEADKLGRGFSEKDKSGSFFSRKKFSIGKWTRKKTAVAATVTIVGAGGIFGLSVLQGPLQFVHFAQMLQKFHLQRNEDFGDNRTSKILLYAVAGKGAQNGRLGVKGNIAANAWEKRLLERTGMRPVYSETTRRFVGFEIVNENKAQEALGSVGDKKNFNTKAIERTMGKGAEIRTAREVRDAGRYRPVSASGSSLDNNTRMVDLTGVNFNDRRAWIRSIGQSTDTWRVSSAIGSRLLIKRAGVDFHPMNKVKDRLDSSADSKKTAQAVEEEIDEEHEKEITNGVDVPDEFEAGKSQDDDGDGVGDTSTAEDESLSSETKDLLKQFKENGVKGLKAAAVPAAAVGVLCAAKSYGDGIKEFRFQNTILPMERMGVKAITTGNQVMSNDNFDMDSLKIASKYLYDKESKTSWSAAASVRAEQGKTGGIPMPQEADLSTAGGKPKLFRVLDQIPGLGTTCGIQNAIFNLPGVKQVTGLIGDITSGALDAALSPFGTNSDSLLLSSMKTISGKSVDPSAKGADFGNLANTGAYLAANDQAISMGGAAMSQQSAMELREYQDSFEKHDQQTKSIADRYFDPVSSTSFFGKMIDNTPDTSSFASAFVGSLKLLSPSKLFGSLPIFSSAGAASSYDYGTPEYGFTVGEQSDQRFENPYENAVIVESRLDDLNNKYGECFNMKITVDDEGPHIESGKSVNTFDIADKSQCQSGSEEFLRYRFYIADVVNTLSLACYEGDNASCIEVGISGSGSANSEGEGSAVSGDAKTLAQQILDNDDITKQPNPKSSLEAAAKGDKSPAGVDQCGTQRDAVALDPKLLGFLAELGTQDAFTITSLTTGAHSCTSNHYKGAAVDFGCDLDTSKADRIGRKYGISHNFENCANNAHWHYSIGGS